MKKIAFALCVLTIMATIAAVPAQAESVRIKGSIPFEFGVGGKTLPAGEYKFETNPQTGVTHVWRTDGAAAQVFVNTISAGQDKAASVGPRAVFVQYNNRYFLRQIWTAGGGEGRGLGETKIEREAKVASVTRKTLTVLAKR